MKLTFVPIAQSTCGSKFLDFLYPGYKKKFGEKFAPHNVCGTNIFHETKIGVSPNQPTPHVCQKKQVRVPREKKRIYLSTKDVFFDFHCLILKFEKLVSRNKKNFPMFGVNHPGTRP